MTIIQQHNEDLENLQMQMKAFFTKGQKVKIYHGSTNSTRAQKFQKNQFIDVSKLDRVIKIDSTERFVLVEPNVPMDKLVKETLKRGLLPPVVMEFPGITVGGGIQGGAGESSSFKYGLFHDICLEYEIVLGNGKLITVSRTKHADLFWGTACSYGSLGVITLVKLRLIPAKEYVHLEYYSVKSFQSAIDLVKYKAKQKVDFIDAIMFTKNRGMIMVGHFTDKKVLPVARFSQAIHEWFYLHVDKISKKGEFYEEIIPVKDYLFRYDRGAFWMGKHGFNLFKIPFNRFSRYFFNPLVKARALYRLLHSTNLSQRYLIQDMAISKENAVKFLDYISKLVGIYPIWFIPLRVGKKDKLSFNFLKTDLVISIGAWEQINQQYSRYLKINRALENKLSALGGRKWLYAHQYYTSQKFWQIYDQNWYNSLRSKYFAVLAFPDIYEKTSVSEKYKSSVFVGCWKYLLSLIPNFRQTI